ncbi:MAG: aminotransferase class III-fold pyridoxal phosphate-dependent enzyme [Acidimicrobiia bacterium]|nr:aminotransferase class III-fold pyridoxal phosphate-dependent enzyme [Acidimicrobiia bacterium]
MSASFSNIETAYRQRTPASARLFEEACRVLPAGLTHDSRATQPYPVYVARASGPRKWDVDGNEYVDYFGGHGALLLGHSHPEVVQAVQQQMVAGTHWGASHELEVRWAELVSRRCAAPLRHHPRSLHPGQDSRRWPAWRSGCRTQGRHGAARCDGGTISQA